MKFLEFMASSFSTSPSVVDEDMLKAGTGMMMTLSQGIRELRERGYKDDLIPHFDHFSACCGRVMLYPSDIVVDDILRFENSSDPGDTSILYALSDKSRTVKGLYVDSYGTYHDELSHEILESIQYSRLLNKQVRKPLI